jgi:DNA helicase-2/ATP-dependent DNA helicase PcrA
MEGKSSDLLHAADEDRDVVLQSPAQDRHAHMPAAILETIVRETRYLEYLTRDEGSESTENNRVSNVRELIRAAERFRSVKELLDYVDHTLEMARLAAKDRSADRVTLCSLHRSKGLEWAVVHVIGCNEKILPHARATNLDEERRLFYVGVTRARDSLRVSWVREAAIGSRVVHLDPSPFLAEVGIAEVA